MIRSLLNLVLCISATAGSYLKFVENCEYLFGFQCPGAGARRARSTVDSDNKPNSYGGRDTPCSGPGYFISNFGEPLTSFEQARVDAFSRMRLEFSINFRAREHFARRGGQSPRRVCRQ